jgi:hypothetical protein
VAALVLIGIPAAVAFLLALLLGGDRRAAAAVVALGASTAAALLIVGFVTAPTERDCSDCEEMLGRFVSPIFMFLVLVGLTGWLAGAVLGIAARRVGAGRGRPDSEP